jgi:hypothetical protein
MSGPREIDQATTPTSDHGSLALPWEPSQTSMTNFARLAGAPDFNEPWAKVILLALGQQALKRIMITSEYASALL